VSIALLTCAWRGWGWRVGSSVARVRVCLVGLVGHGGRAGGRHGRGGRAGVIVRRGQWQRVVREHVMVAGVVISLLQTRPVHAGKVAGHRTEKEQAKGGPLSVCYGGQSCTAEGGGCCKAFRPPVVRVARLVRKQDKPRRGSLLIPCTYGHDATYWRREGGEVLGRAACAHLSLLQNNYHRGIRRDG